MLHGNNADLRSGFVFSDGDKHAGLFNGAPLPNVDVSRFGFQLRCRCLADRFLRSQTSLRSGPKGATALHDPVARERISHFDHERIPERVVHARGAGAHGKFTLHKSLEHVTCAKVLTEVGKETPVFTRFSTVLGQKGAAETAREVRGFAVKMCKFLLDHRVTGVRLADVSRRFQTPRKVTGTYANLMHRSVFRMYADVCLGSLFL